MFNVVRAVAIMSLLVAVSTMRPAAAEMGKSAAGFQDCPQCPQMVVVPAGTFDMGFEGGETGRHEGPVRRVTIGYAFAVGKYEVTNAQYGAFVTATGHVDTTDCHIFDVPAPGATWHDPHYGRPIRDDEPVVCVTWKDAKAYVAWLSSLTGQRYRLLSEAEWEYAARAGAGGVYAWGDDPNAGCATANLYDRAGARVDHRPGPVADCEDGFAGVAPVGSLKPNAFGLHDMIGNVWEWVEDCYVTPYPAAPVDGSPREVSGSCDLRSVRGGAWPSALFRQRPTWRGRDPEDRIVQIFGMRIARDLSPTRP